MDVTFNVPDKYFNVRSRLVITPQLMSADSVLGKFTPIVLDAPVYAKKKKRIEVLEQYADPYAEEAVAVKKVSQSFEIPYHQEVETADLPGSASITGVVSTDGCGKCRGIDTIYIAGIADPADLIDIRESLQLSWMEPEFIIRPKVIEDRGVANLQFVINKHDIDLDLGNNRAELEEMLGRLTPVLSDSLATLTSLAIYGMASADGSLPFNTTLARNRAASAKEWLTDTLSLSPGIQRIIEVGSRPEGWNPVLDAMIADGNRDSILVRDILDKYAGSNDDVQEFYIRKLPCWKQIREKYLQKDRKVEYVFTYTLRSFTTDGELLAMYEKRPDAFNESELLRVASIAETAQEKKSVYETILGYFPQSQVASNNLAVLYLREGNEEKAREILLSQKEYSDESLNTLAASYVYAEDYEMAIRLLQNVDMPVARYNLGLIRAKQRKLKEAYELLRPFEDVNSAVCALSVNENKDAKAIMDVCDDESPVAEYVRSMVGARLDDEDIFSRHILNACKDNELKMRAKDEPDFMKYMSNETFLKILNR